MAARKGKPFQREERAVFGEREEDRRERSRGSTSGAASGRERSQSSAGGKAGHLPRGRGLAASRVNSRRADLRTRRASLQRPKASDRSSSRARERRSDSSWSGHHSNRAASDRRLSGELKGSGDSKAEAARVLARGQSLARSRAGSGSFAARADAARNSVAAGLVRHAEDGSGDRPRTESVRFRRTKTTAVPSTPPQAGGARGCAQDGN